MSRLGALFHGRSATPTKDECPSLRGGSGSGTGDAADQCPAKAGTTSRQHKVVTSGAVTVALDSDTGKSTTIHYSPDLPSSAIRTQIVSKLALSSNQFYLLTPVDEVIEQKRVILDPTPEVLSYFANKTLTVVLGTHSSVAVKGPRPIPVFGNAHQLPPDAVSSLRHFSATYGDVFQLRIFDIPLMVISNADMVQQILYESPFFTKKVFGLLQELTPLGGRGLFTSHSSDPKWAKAHKLLIPGFGASPLKMYIPEMIHVTEQLCDVLDKRIGEPIDATEIGVRFTFQTIGICGFGFDFHLLDGPNAPMHPFIDAMNFCLKEAKVRSSSLQFYKALPITANKVWTTSLALMQNTVAEVIKTRRASKESKRDMLDFMLNAKDENGESLDDENIRDQVLTFLIAGHETTSNLLCFTLYTLVQQPAVENRLLDEIVRVCGTDSSQPITPHHLAQLTFTTQIIKEVLRLYPPVTGIAKTCLQDTVLGGNVVVAKGVSILVHIIELHRNRSVWGPNPDVFNPDHFSKENELKRHKCAWLPFSMGERSCLGMAFALQEIKIALAYLVRKYRFEYRGVVPAKYDPAAVTLRPLNLTLYFHKRDTQSLASAASAGSQAPKGDAAVRSESVQSLLVASENVAVPSMTVVWSGQMGTSEDFACQIAQAAKRFRIPTQVMVLDDWSAKSPVDRDSFHVFVTSSYNGFPPSNGERAAAWLKEQHDLSGLRYAVFGCGNSQWRTYQAFPRLINERLTSMGAELLIEVGDGDADGDIEDDFVKWHAKFWVTLQSAYNVKSTGADESKHPMLTVKHSEPEDQLKLKMVDDGPKKDTVPRSYVVAKLVGNRELLKASTAFAEASDKSTRHLEFELPQAAADGGDAQAYRAGDHFEIWPKNDPDHVRAVAQHLEVSETQQFSIDGQIRNTKSALAVVRDNSQSGPCSVLDALTYFCDVTGPPTRLLAELVLRKQGQTEAADRVGSQDKEEYLLFLRSRRRSLDAILSCKPPPSLLEVLLSCAPIISRRYSIASSALAAPSKVKLCVGVASNGLCSRYLQRAPEGELVFCRVQACRDTFHLPSDPAVPIIMVAAGTGLAPFMSFLEERKALGATSDCHLFYGCRHPEHDAVYEEELKKYIQDGHLTKVHIAFSRLAGSSTKYVQHAVQQQADLVFDLMEKRNANFYVCGSAKGMAKDLYEVMAQIAADMLRGDGHQWVNNLQQTHRYCEDVWG